MFLEAIGSLASGITSGIFGANQAKKNRAFQERMYNKQVEDNRENWRMANEYNLPSAVLQRLKDAKLNPLLYYQDGSGSGLSSVATGGSLPSGAQGTAQFQNPFAGFTANYIAMQKMQAEIDVLKSQEMKNINEGLAASAQFVKSHAESENIQTETEYNSRSMDARLESIHAENRLKNIMSKSEEWKIEETKKSVEKIDADIDFVYSTISNNERMTDQNIAESKARIANANKETAQRVATMKAEERKALADAWLAKENARTVRDTHDSVVEKYKADMHKAIAEGDAQELQNIMNAYEFDKMPAPGSKTWKYQKWIENYVNPITQSLGAILGGAVSGTVAAKIKAKP